ncbi:exo-alpha-sialidase [Trypanosoma cruzi]|nr:exo-alpha-sialidase [Trypanosoma cruzi]
MGILFLCSGGRKCPTRQPVTPHRAENTHSPNRRSNGSSPLPRTVPPSPVASPTAWELEAAGTCCSSLFFRDCCEAACSTGASEGGAISSSKSALPPVNVNGRLYNRTFDTVTDTSSSPAVFSALTPSPPM